MAHDKETQKKNQKTQKKKNQVEESSRFLNELVNVLYGVRGPIAFVFGKAANVKNYIFDSVSRISKTDVQRRARILTMVAEGLRYVPISVPLYFRVTLPPVYLAYNQQSHRRRTYAQICEATGFSSLASLEFTEEELSEFKWDISVGSLDAKQPNARLRTVTKDGVDHLTDSIDMLADTLGCLRLTRDTIVRDSDSAQEITMPEGLESVSRKRGPVGPRAGVDKRKRAEHGDTTDGHQPPSADPSDNPDSRWLSSPTSQPPFENAVARTPDGNSRPPRGQWTPINGGQLQKGP